MRGMLSPLVAVQLLLFLDFTAAIPSYDDSEKLSGKREALLLYKRQQSSACNPGYFQCPDIFGGGCCAQGRMCATTDCPPLPVGEADPNALGGSGSPSVAAQTSAAPAATSAAAPRPTSAAPPAQTTAAPPPSAAVTSQPTTSGASAAVAADQTASGASSSSSATAAASSSSSSSSGISKGAIVGIAFAGVTGAIIVVLVLWRAIIGLRHRKPKRKPKKRGGAPMAPGQADVGTLAAGAGPSSAGGKGGAKRFTSFLPSIPWGKKGGAASRSLMQQTDDSQPMTQEASAMGYAPPPGAPAYSQQGGGYDDQDTSYGGPTRGGGDLGYRQVDTYESRDDDAMQGLFPSGGRNAGFPDR